jgi:hypothetical protein
MKIHIDREEWYPVYYISSDIYCGEQPHEVPEETVNKWNRVFAEFKAVQEEMRKLVEGE